MRSTNPGWRWQLVLLASLFAGAAGCHQVIIDGGLEPSETRYDEEWNLAFAAAIFPAKVEPPEGCNGYFAEVQTRHSFLNVVVTALTWGIISPMESRIRCGNPDSTSGPDQAAATEGEATDATR